MSQQQSNPQWQCCHKIYTAPTLGFGLGLFSGLQTQIHHNPFAAVQLLLSPCVLLPPSKLKMQHFIPNIDPQRRKCGGPLTQHFMLSGIILITSLTPSLWPHYILRQPIPLMECVTFQWAKSLYFQPLILWLSSGATQNKPIQSPLSRELAIFFPPSCLL